MIPNVTREIGGVNYTLRFSAGTSIAIEREFETKITDLPKMLGDDPDVTIIARLVKLCMRKDDKMLTDAEFETVLDAITVEELCAKYLEAAHAVRGQRGGLKGDPVLEIAYPHHHNLAG